MENDQLHRSVGPFGTPIDHRLPGAAERTVDGIINGFVAREPPISDTAHQKFALMFVNRILDPAALRELAAGSPPFETIP